MLERVLTYTYAIRRYRAGYFGPYLDGFVELLANQGYPRSTVQSKLHRVNALGKWLARHGVNVAEIHSSHVAAFLDSWRRRGRFNTGDAATVHGILNYLRAHGVVTAAPAVGAPSLRAEVEAEYARYLDAERGLCGRTVINYLYHVRQLPAVIATGERAEVTNTEPRQISDFMLSFARSTNLSRAKNMAKVLRSFLRFLFLAGRTGQDLSGAVPTVPGARLATIPKYLRLDDIDRVLESCDQNTAVGRRDHALLLLLARLGLRAGEIVKLTLDHID